MNSIINNKKKRLKKYRGDNKLYKKDRSTYSSFSQRGASMDEPELSRILNPVI